jgi:hypothetical protein
MTTLAEIVSRFGAEAKAKLSGTTADGAPEDQLRSPLEQLVKAMGQLIGLPHNAVTLVGEPTLAGMQTRPDFAVIVDKRLAGYIEVKAPGKGFDPSKLKGEHDKTQWGKLKSLPNILYTDGNGFSLWHDGQRDGDPVALDGDIETSGAKTVRAQPTHNAVFELPALAAQSAEIGSRTRQDIGPPLPPVA